MSTGRLRSLDIFRGATIASMILVNSADMGPTYSQLEHAEWHGWTFTDTVFPFFLWIVGFAMSLSTAKRVERGEDKIQLLKHAFVRALIIFLLGFLLGPFPHIDFSTIRVLGVLQRIAICYFLATLIFLFTTRRLQIAAVIGLNALYWGLMMFYPTPGCVAGSLTKDCNFARYIDGLFLTNHMWKHTRYWDPEGIVSTIPAITTVLLGLLAGQAMRMQPDPRKAIRGGLLRGIALLGVGQLMAIWMPINKNLWTSSFVFFMAGLATLCFTAWYLLADVRGRADWLKPFEIFGSNSILMFLLSGTLGKTMGDTGGDVWFYNKVCLALASPPNAAVLYALANVLACYLVAWALWKKRWFLKF